MSANFFFRNIFSRRAIFVQTLHIFLILFRKHSITFHCNQVQQNTDTFFLALWVQKLRNKSNQRKRGSKFNFGFGSTCATRCKIFRRTAEILGAESKILGAQLQILVAPTPKEYLLALKKEQFRLPAAIYGPILALLNTMKTIKESGYCTQELSLDINY